ncbi:MAG TPA: endonuclease domain-containing protein [Chloroflexota bacterium]|jgi:very-short-patch-repair endonuclease
MKPAPEAVVARRRELRRTQTDAERLLWRHLRSSQAEVKFRRQETAGPYILDFYCREANLAIELDGDQHAAPDKIAYDRRRTEFLNQQGIEVVRFSNLDVLTRTPDVLQAVWGSLTLALSRCGGRGDD